MPRRYPLGIQTFQKIIEENMLYVDKTELIYKLTQSYSYVFLSRPRRFGKSLLVSTLASYFRGEKDLFKGLAIERLEKQWKKHPVIHLSLASVKEIEPEKIRSLLNGLLAEQEKFYGIASASDTLGGRLKNLITSCYEKYGEKVVVILDEYDAPLLNVLHDEERVKEVRQLMRTLYAPLKDCDPYLRFVFITGISKFSQLSIFSEINNLKVISMMPEYATLCGFTQQEIEEAAGRERGTYSGANPRQAAPDLRRLSLRRQLTRRLQPLQHHQCPFRRNLRQLLVLHRHTFVPRGDAPQIPHRHIAY